MSVRVEPFYISKLPITNEQFQAFDPGFLAAESSPGERDTAVGVSYEEALAYCRWYAEVSRKPMRLPSEIEWEHACRGGTSGRCFYDEDEDPDLYQWDRQNSGGRLPPLDAKKANGFGLFGMLGGVWEWTSLPGSTAARPGSAGTPVRNSDPVLRGGSFHTPRAEIRCTSRRGERSDYRSDDVGFRIVKSLHVARP